MALTEKQKIFCDEYLISFNATEAAIKAGYSQKTAYSIGSENLRKPEIQEYLSEVRQRDAEKLNITREKVLAEYAKIAFFDIRKIYTVDGVLKQIRDIDDESAGAIAGVESFEEFIYLGEQIPTGTTKKVKIWDKRAALDSICKVLGYNSPDKQEVNVSGPVITIGGKKISE